MDAATGTAVPALGGLPKPPGVPSLPTPTSATASTDSTSSAAQTRLDALLGTLRASRDSLPPDLVKMLGDVDAHGAQQEANKLHQAVTDKTAAKKELYKARAAHRSYVQSWSAYLDQLTKVLGEQFTEQEAALTAFAEAETKWTDKLQEATMVLAKLSGGAQNVDSDSEDMQDAGEGRGKNPEEDDDPWKTEEAAQDLRKRQQDLMQAPQRRQDKAAAAATTAEDSKRDGSRTPRRRDKEVSEGAAVPTDAQT